MAGHNHKPWCTCGWCVKSTYTVYTPPVQSQNHPIKIVKSSYTYKWDYPHIKKIETYKSFVNPNAKCPVCHQDVFFYQSPYGGKVFFDELGPPWTKHPCTDNNNFNKAPLGIKKYKNILPKNNFLWINTSWKPNIIKNTDKLNNKIFSFTTNKDKSYISISSKYKIRIGSILHIRRTHNFFYEASILNEKNLEKKVILILKQDFYSSSIPIQILVDIFFKAYREENKILMEQIINHKIITNHGFDKIFKFIYKRGINTFLTILKKISTYCPKSIIMILKSTEDIYIKTIVGNIFK